MEILIHEYASLLQGGLVVIVLAAGLLTLGFFLGLTLAAMEVYGNRYVSFLASSTQKIIRGVPALVLLYLGLFGLTALIDMPTILVAIIALGVRSAAYQSQIFRGAIQAIESGQMEAAQAIGMSKIKAIRYIIIPQVLRRAIGPWTNEFSAEVKDTSLAYAIGVLEILKRGRFIINYSHGNAMLIYCVIAIYFFILTRTGNAILYRIERRISIPGFERRSRQGRNI
jgi:polar amino acid transport system permease protein